MSYRVLTSPAGLPFVPALGEGLGQEPSGTLPESAPWWGHLIQSVGLPLAEGTAARIAGSGAYPSRFTIDTPRGQYSGGAYGGFDPTTLVLIGGAALLAMMLMKS